MPISFRGALVVLLFFVSFHGFAAPLDHEWLSLLRYNKYGNKYLSEADSPQFFLSTGGPSNPESEYSELAKQLATPVTTDDHPACRFPARALKLYRDKAISLIPDFKKCTKLNQYLRATNAKSASLVFAGYFIQKPSSAFGHTFLRLHTNQQGDAALLDFAVDFSASVNTSNPIAYGVKGIIGGFPGRFSRMPYFLKLREYADLESRDVWEYPLNLTTAQTQLLVLHLWEMDQAYFDYFYFSENCSYHILRAIEAVSDKHVVQNLKFFVTPLDTIHALEDSGLLLEPTKRPSQYSVLNASLDRLSQNSRQVAELFLKDPIAFTESLPTDSETLDAFIEILNFRFAEQLLTDQATDKVKTLRRKILIARSSALDSAPIETNSSDKPSLGHRGSWLDLSYSFNDHTFLQITNTFAVHNFRFDSLGFSSRFQMSMGEFSLRVSGQDLHVSSFKVFDVLNASSSFSIDFSPAWRFSLGFDRLYVESNLRPYALISSGLSFDLADNLLFMLALDIRPRLAEDAKKALLPIGPSLIAVSHFASFRLGLEASAYRELLNKNNEYVVNPFIRRKVSAQLDTQLEAKLLKNETLYSAGITYFY